MTISQIRQQARELLKNLKGKWELFILPVLLPYITFGFSLRRSFITLYGESLDSIQSYSLNFNPFPQIWNFLIAVISLSVSFTLLDIYRKSKVKASFDDCFRAFSGQYILKVFIAYILRILLILPWFILMYLPVFALIQLYIFFPFLVAETQDIQLVIGIIVFFIGVFMMANRLIAYSQVELILYDKIQEGKEVRTLDLFKESKAMMKGQKLNYLFLQLSFLGWYLLVLVTFGLANFFVLPYHTTANVLFYENLSRQQ